MRLLGHFGEVAPLSEAHGNLLVSYLHVLAHLLSLNHSLAIDSTKDIFETVVHCIGAIKVLILTRKRFSKLSNASWFPELVFFTHCTKFGCASLIGKLADGHRVARGGWRGLANKISMELSMPWGLHFSAKADIWNIAAL